jgi:hypothetical protein
MRYKLKSTCFITNSRIINDGTSPSGKALVFGTSIRRFESYRPSQALHQRKPLIFMHVYPKDFILNSLMGEIGDIIRGHAYLSFILICSGIELLGKCLEPNASFSDDGKQGEYFKKAIKELFPECYHDHIQHLYSDLRCGMLHSYLAGKYKLMELKNDPAGQHAYATHLAENSDIIVLDYLFFDFIQACQKVLNMDFAEDDKMTKPFIIIGPAESI